MNAGMVLSVFSQAERMRLHVPWSRLKRTEAVQTGASAAQQTGTDILSRVEPLRFQVPVSGLLRNQGHLKRTQKWPI